MMEYSQDFTETRKNIGHMVEQVVLLGNDPHTPVKVTQHMAIPMSVSHILDLIIEIKKRIKMEV